MKPVWSAHDWPQVRRAEEVPPVALPTALAQKLSDFAKGCPPLPGMPQWPEPGVTVLLKDCDDARLCGVWLWDGRDWLRPTYTGSTVVRMAEGKI